MQRLLVIGKVWPEPGSSAAGSRTLQLMDLFTANNWKIFFASAAQENENSALLQQKNVEKHAIVLNDSTFDEWVKQINPHLVIFDRFTTEEQFGWRVAEHCPQAIRLLDTIDLHCLRSARQKAVKENRTFTLQDLIAEEISQREIASVYRSDLSIMISSAEMSILESVFNIPASTIHYAPFLPDRLNEAGIAGLPVFEERKHFVSIGNFLHEPNFDSVLQLKNVIWPLIRKQLPGAELHIYGAYASQKVYELNAPRDGFLILGRAKDAMEVMQKARICLAPLRFGAGMKGKLLDAMMSGTPSITTTIGAEGMHENLNWCGEIEDNPAKFAEKAIALYSDEKAWKQAQLNGLAILNQVFDKAKHGSLLIERVQEILENSGAHRRQNFIGNLLLRQSNLATKYMALWIEEKNKKR